jgi:diacylglycerol kinase (ATP)
MRIGVAINPVAGGVKGQAVGQEVLEILEASGLQFVNLSGENMVSARNAIDSAIDRGAVDVLLVVGGDGMAHLGVNTCAQKNIPIGIVPAGTGNDAASILGMPLNDTRACVELILKNLSTPQSIDAVKITHGTKTTWALGSVSAGFDALVNAKANKMKWPKGPNRYYVAMLLELAKFKPIKYSCMIDGTAQNFEAMLCVVSNTGVFGGGMLVVPTASATDGVLDLLLLKKMSRFKFLSIFPRVYKGTHVTDKDVEILRASNISITANGMPIYSDGEYVGQAPFEAQVVAAALKVITPAIKGAS